MSIKGVMEQARILKTTESEKRLAATNHLYFNEIQPNFNCI